MVVWGLNSNFGIFSRVVLVGFMRIKIDNLVFYNCCR